MTRQNNIRVIGENIRSIIRKYDEYVVYGSILASIIIQFVPDAVPWKDSAQIVLIYTGILSLIFILLDIKDIVERKEEAVWFQNMFEARDAIYSKIEETRKLKRRDEVVEVTIVGLKLRAIVGLLHQLNREIKEGARHLYKIRFLIYYYDPEALDDLICPNTPEQVSQKLKAQFDEFKIIIRANVNELHSYNEEELYRQLDITFRCYPYRNFPSFWGFGIDNEVAFVGTFTWDGDKYSFVGPQNRCMMVDETNELGHALLNFHYNRFQLYSDWARV